ncbi:hypothetical protein NEOLI_005099, partial [Neolecta irregularis DAH-3]
MSEHWKDYYLDDGNLDVEALLKKNIPCPLFWAHFHKVDKRIQKATKNITKADENEKITKKIQIKDYYIRVAAETDEDDVCLGRGTPRTSSITGDLKSLRKVPKATEREFVVASKLDMTKILPPPSSLGSRKEAVSYALRS